MVPSPKPDLVAIANTALRRVVVRMTCEDGFPDVMDAMPIFVVGNRHQAVELLTPLGSILPKILEYQDVSRGGLADLRPKVVVSRLISTSFDVFDLADLLTEFSFVGRYIALTENIPDLKLIHREVLARRPNIDFMVCRATQLRLRDQDSDPNSRLRWPNRRRS